MSSATELFCEELNLDVAHQPAYVLHSRLEVPSQVDQVLVADQRVMSNMLKEEELMAYDIVDYCSTIQMEIKPHMRKIVTDWMVEVCEDQQCSPEVFSLAVNYLDRFLSRVNIRKNQFQLVACACLLLASKFTEVMPVTSEKLVLYTDNSVTVSEIRDLEMKVLAILRWELATVTAHSFLQHFFNSIHLDSKLSNTVRRHAETLVAIAATEYKFLSVKPSIIAAASLAAACSGLTRSQNSTVDLINVLSSKIQSSAASIFFVLVHIEQYISTFVSKEVVSPATVTANTTALPPFHTVSSKSYSDVSLTPTDSIDVSTAMAA